jgi:predicted ATPase
MLKSVQIKNFKALKQVELELGGLNLFAGLNGMGKSSVIQALLLLKQSAGERGRLRLNDPEFASLGKGKDVFYQFAEEPSIAISIKSRHGKRWQWRFAYEPEKDHLEGETRHDPADLAQNLALFSDNFQYLAAERIGPRPSYTSSSLYSEVIGQIGSRGEFAVHYLDVYGSSQEVISDVLHHPKARSRSLIHQADAWMGEVSPGTKLNTTKVPGTEMVLLDIQFETDKDYTNRFRPVNVGFGISFVLPVILALLMARKDRLIIIENPEAHLHPRGQVEIGRLMGLAATAGAQVIAETHSDHVLNGIRVAVKNGAIPKEEVRIFFFDRVQTDFEQYAHATTIKIDDSGELSAYPPNFLDEWNNQLFKLI